MHSFKQSAARDANVLIHSSTNPPPLPPQKRVTAKYVRRRNRSLHMGVAVPAITL